MNQKIHIENASISISIKREDLLHPIISGNKFRKLKYNLKEAIKQKKSKLVTFGGAFSNHILAVAAAGKELGFETIGIIRGDELADKILENPTLFKAQKLGMKFKFVDREMYRNKNEIDFRRRLELEFQDFYLLPEGGTNELAIQGCEEILTDLDNAFDFICCPVGTGGTISGVINCSKESQQVLGFPALCGDFLKEDIRKFATKSNWNLITDYDFGGYAKVSDELIRFMNDIYSQYNILLDPIYTGKMMFGVMDLIEKDFFPKNSRILVIHTGGLQGIAGINAKLRKKNKIEISGYEK